MSIHDAGHDENDGVVVSCNQPQPCCDALKGKSGSLVDALPDHASGFDAIPETP